MLCNESLTTIFCYTEPIEKPTCVYAADIAFLLDSSDGISTDDYDKQKSLIISIARSFGISHKTSRAAVVSYSDTASVHFQFGDSSSTREFERAVNKMPHQKGPARLDKAFDVAVRDVFPYGRMGIPKIAFVVTNGKQASGEDVKALDEASRPLRRAGVKVVALGVGAEVDPKELRLMVEDDENDILLADSYDELILDRKKISHKICEEAGKFRGPCHVAYALASPMSFETSARRLMPWGTQRKTDGEVGMKPGYNIPKTYSSIKT